MSSRDRTNRLHLRTRYLKVRKAPEYFESSVSIDDDGEATAPNGTIPGLSPQDKINSDTPSRAMTTDTATEDLMGDTNSRPESAAIITSVDKNTAHGKTQVAAEPEEEPSDPQEITYCTICGGPLAIKTLHEKVHFHQNKAKTLGFKPWLYKKMYVAVSLEHLQKDSRFIPENTGHLDFLMEKHENFNKYEDFRKLDTTSRNDAAPVSSLPYHLRSREVIGESHKKKNDLRTLQDGNSQKRRLSKEKNVASKVQDSDLYGPPYGAYPMHEACCIVASRYITATRRKGDKLMRTEGVSSWLELYRNLQTHWAPQRKTGTVLVHQHPHGYHGAAEFQGQDGWKRVEASKVRYMHNGIVFEASPLSDSSYTTTYILSKLRPLLQSHNNNNSSNTERDPRGENREQDTVMTDPQSHHQAPAAVSGAANIPWSSIPLYRGSLQWLLLQNTPGDLPLELINFVRSDLNGLHNPPLKRSRPTYLPEYWREILLRGFPWLWDLDREQCRLKDSETYDDGSKIRWDWERLVRFLAQDDVFTAATSEEGGWEGLRDAPEGLRNRRRIWRCLDEMK